MTQIVCQAYIESTVVENNWSERLEELEEFIEEHGSLPTKESKDPDEKGLGSWRSNQTQNYKNNKKGMSDPERRKLWEEHKEKYPELYVTDDERWSKKICNDCTDDYNKRE